MALSLRKRDKGGSWFPPLRVSKSGAWQSTSLSLRRTAAICVRIGQVARCGVYPELDSGWQSMKKRRKAYLLSHGTIVSFVGLTSEPIHFNVISPPRRSSGRGVGCLRMSSRNSAVSSVAFCGLPYIACLQIRDFSLSQPGHTVFASDGGRIICYDKQ